MNMRLALLMAACGLVAGGLPGVAAESPSNLRRDEQVELFATAAVFDPARGVWTIPVRGVVYEPETNSLRRGVVVAALRGALGLDKTSAEAELFQQRVRLFLVDNERGKVLRVTVGPRTFSTAKTGENGHFECATTLSAEQVAALRFAGALRDGWLAIQAKGPASDPRRFAGRVALVEPEGLSVVSDIDDTIKVSDVLDKKKLLLNTFTKPFVAAPGMAELYTAIAKAGGSRPVAFHYVSASPWQLYQPLDEFLQAEGFPVGTFHMRHFRVKDKSLLEIFASPADYKIGVIEELLARYPQRRFLMVGDTGEQDPEVYGRLAGKHPRQIVGVLLRNVNGETADSARLTAARGDYAGVWRLFDAPDAALRKQCAALADNAAGKR